MANPRQYKIPDWFLNRQKDIVDGKYSQVWIYLSWKREEKNLSHSVELLDHQKL